MVRVVSCDGVERSTDNGVTRPCSGVTADDEASIAQGGYPWESSDGVVLLVLMTLCCVLLDKALGE
jgi:hypothetical protein